MQDALPLESKNKGRLVLGSRSYGFFCFMELTAIK
jgi:hypothetical protein